MEFTLDSSQFLKNFSSECLKTSTKSTKNNKKYQKTPKTRLSQIFSSSPDLLRPETTLLNTRKHCAIASPMLKVISSEKETMFSHEINQASNKSNDQNLDQMLQQTRKHLKQVFQQITSSIVQLELETSIKTLDHACSLANLDSLKQIDEAFHQKLDVQQQLDNFKTEVNVKLDKILAMSTTSAKSEQTVKTTTSSLKKPVTTRSANAFKPVTYAAITSNKDQNSQNSWTTVQKKVIKPKKINKPIFYRERRLVMTPKTSSTTINAIDMRNKVNKALQTVKIFNLLISTVAVSQSKTSIVFTVCEKTAEDLLKHQNIWNSLFEFKNIKKDEK